VSITASSASIHHYLLFVNKRILQVYWLDINCEICHKNGTPINFFQLVVFCF